MLVQVPLESALSVLVPEAEPLVGRWRAAHDPSCAVGVTAHVTLLYPFRRPQQIDDALLEELAQLFAALPSFSFELASVGRFPGVLYLAPEPAAPFKTMIRRLMLRFPEHPPYGGAFTEVVPHVTVAQSEDEPTLDRVAAELRGFAPICCAARATTVSGAPSPRFHLDRMLLKLHSASDISQNN